MQEPKVILIIDDEPDLVMMLKGLLKSNGYYVLTAGNGKEGLQKISQAKPHLIILDINMPEMDGAAFYGHIYDRVNRKTQYPVLVLTARTNLGELFAKLDVDGFMTKPFGIEELMKEVNLIMMKRYGVMDVAELEIRTKRKADKRSPKVLVIEDDQTTFDKIVVTFVNRGYELKASKSGKEGLEAAMIDPPDMILVKLGLPDVPGDLVALKLKRLPKTMDIPIILYKPYDIRAEYSIEKSLCEKEGIDRIIESNDPQTLLRECESIWQKNSQQ